MARAKRALDQLDAEDVDHRTRDRRLRLARCLDDWAATVGGTLHQRAAGCVAAIERELGARVSVDAVRAALQRWDGHSGRAAKWPAINALFCAVDLGWDSDETARVELHKLRRRKA